LSEDVDWKPFPAFPPRARLAVMVGQPTEPGPYVIRVKVPAGVKLMPHRSEPGRRPAEPAARGLAMIIAGMSVPSRAS
jgi:hypothetical protein